MKDIIMKYRDKSKYDYSCSETILKAFGEKYKLQIDDTHMSMIAPFSGGMFEQETCGILTSGLTVLGLLFTNEVAHTSDKLQEAVVEFKKKFTTMFQSPICAQLIPVYRDEVEGCTDLIVDGAILLDKVIQKYGK